MRKPVFKLTTRRRITLGSMLFMALPLAVYFIFCIVPSLESFFYSFFEWDGLSDDIKFVGFNNYIKLFTADTVFHTSIVNTVIYTIVVVIFQSAISLAIAALIYKKSAVNNLYRTLFYLPVIFSSVTIGFIWSFIYDPNIGVLNTVLDMLGLRSWQHVWLSEKTVSIIAIAAVHVWWGIGQSMILYIAGLQNVPLDQLESARLDGCNGWQEFWHVTIPSIMPVITVVFVLITIGSFRTFDLVYTMTGGGADNSSMVLALQSYRESFRFGRVGYGSAISVVLLTVVGALSVFQSQVLDKE